MGSRGQIGVGFDAELDFKIIEFYDFEEVDFIHFPKDLVLPNNILA